MDFVELNIVFNPFPNKPLILQVCTVSLLKTLWGKEEIACNKQFLPFPQCFLPVWRTFYHFHHIWNCRLQTFSLEESKICHLRKG